MNKQHYTAPELDCIEMQLDKGLLEFNSLRQRALNAPLMVTILGGTDDDGGADW